MNNQDESDDPKEIRDIPAPKVAMIEEAPVVLPEAEQASRTLTPQPKPSSSKAEVTVAPNLTDLVAGRIETTEEEEAVRKRRSLNEVVHGILLFGLGSSTILMVVGLVLDFVRHRGLPNAVPTFGEVFRHIAELRPSGFLTLGLLVLVATPILRVIGSLIAFLYEHDWRYAAITLVVLLVVSLSLLLGQG